MISAAVIVLALGGLGFIGFGLAYAIRPARMARLTDLTLASATARADFIATYGGFQIGFGVFLIACAWNDRWAEPGLWAMLAALTGFASLRALIAALHGGRVARTVWLGLGLELIGVALSAWALGHV